jgi:Trk-type K+ transport system membrane component
LLGGIGVLVTCPVKPGGWVRLQPRRVPLGNPAWVPAALADGVPFSLVGTFGGLLDSTFEAMRGFTTTGATLLSDMEAETPSILFWRSMSQWLGGIGIVVLFVAVAPTPGFGAARLLGGGLRSHRDQIHAAHRRHRQSAS